MTPELGLILAAGSVLAFTVSLGVVVLRVPRCPGCGRPGVAEARQIADVHPALVEVIYAAGRARSSSVGARSATPGSDTARRRRG
jgi:hypothetical protein